VANVTLVNTAEELQLAIDDGAQHIEINSHLVLTAITPINSYGSLDSALGYISSPTSSIRVRNSTASASC
jgi:copper homeostasis protein CutC